MATTINFNKAITTTILRQYKDTCCICKVYQCRQTDFSEYRAIRAENNIRKPYWERLTPPERLYSDIHDRAKKLRKAVKNAMNTAIPLIKNNRPVSKQPWTDELLSFHETVSKTRRSYQHALTAGERQHHVVEYRQIKQQYQQKLRSRHVSNKIRSPTLLSSLESEDGTITNTWLESTEVLLQTLHPDDHQNQDDEAKWYLNTIWKV